MSTLNIGINHSGSIESGTITDKRSIKKERLAKSDSAFRTISEVADEINVAQHVLRFWESKFMQIEPLKRGGGRRYYRPEDVELIKKIHNLLYNQGFTIRGVQKLLKGDKHLDGLSVNTSMSALVAEEKAAAAPRTEKRGHRGDIFAPTKSAAKPATEDKAKPRAARPEKAK